jgi:hypothetical protein
MERQGATIAKFVNETNKIRSGATQATVLPAVQQSAAPTEDVLAQAMLNL